MALALPPTSTYSKSMRTTRYVLIVAALTGFTGTAFAWSNHAMVSYRALERMPELSVQVAAEPLEAFLKNEDKAIEALLRDDEDWASKAVDTYPPLPAALAYRADPAKSDAQRRKEFLAALRVSPESRLALYVQPDPWGPAPDPARLLPATAVNALDKSIGVKLTNPISLNTVHANVCTGGSVQHGLSTAGGVLGFYEHCSAFDKR